MVEVSLIDAERKFEGENKMAEKEKSADINDEVIAGIWINSSSGTSS